MKISVTMKPIKFTAPTKEGVFRKSGLLSMVKTSGTHGNYYTPALRQHNHRFAYFFALEKQRTKFKQSKKKIKNPDTDSPFDMITSTHSKKVRDKQWIMYLYKIDLQLLEVAGLRVNQNLRTYTLEKK